MTQTVPMCCKARPSVTVEMLGHNMYYCFSVSVWDMSCVQGKCVLEFMMVVALYAFSTVPIIDMKFVIMEVIFFDFVIALALRVFCFQIITALSFNFVVVVPLYYMY